MRPIIPVTLLYRHKLVQFEALIDSGADYNIFHGDIAVYLGINLTHGSKRIIHGLGGDSVKGYEHSVRLKFREYIYQSTIIFSNQLPENSLAVLGNQGFFDHFCVCFEYRHQSVTLSNR